MHSAARTRTDAGEAASTKVFIRVVAAAGAACCSLAIDCEKVARRAARYARSNSGSFIHRISVGTEIPTTRAASSWFFCVNRAATATSILRLNLEPWPFIWYQLRSSAGPVAGFALPSPTQRFCLLYERDQSDEWVAAVSTAKRRLHRNETFFDRFCQQHHNSRVPQGRQGDRQPGLFERSAVRRRHRSEERRV